LRRWLGAPEPPVVRFNSKRRGDASTRTLAASLRRAGASMNVENDVLVVVLTSHGHLEEPPLFGPAVIES
jgi:hypothetical protein